MGKRIADRLRAAGRRVLLLIWRGVVWLSGALLESVLETLDMIWMRRPAELVGWLIHDVCLSVAGHRRSDVWGVIFLVGKKGDGKSFSVVEHLDRLRQRPEKVRPHILTNFEWAHEDGQITGWRQLAQAGALAKELGRPVVVGFDEIGRTFTSREWEKMPDDVIEMVTMARKYGVQIVATVQRFNRADIQLREQADWIVECRSLFDFGQGARLIIQRWYRGADVYLDGYDRPGMPKRDVARRRFIISSDRLRKQYDTDKIIAKLLERSDEDLPSRQEMVTEAWSGRTMARFHSNGQGAAAPGRGRWGGGGSAARP